ncbi:hypothetical protein D3C71_1648650 [compost metagenome]
MADAELQRSLAFDYCLCGSHRDAVSIPQFSLDFQTSSCPDFAVQRRSYIARRQRCAVEHIGDVGGFPGKQIDIPKNTGESPQILILQITAVAPFQHHDGHSVHTGTHIG